MVKENEMLPFTDKMQKLPIFLVLCFTAVQASQYADNEMADLDPRLFTNLLNTTNSLVPISIGAVLASIGGLMILVLLGLGIWLLVSSLLFPSFDNSGYSYDSYGGYGGSHSGSSYSGYQAR